MEFTREQLIAWIRGNVGGDEANAIAAMLEEDAKFRAVVYRLEAEHRDCEPAGDCSLASDLLDLVRGEA